MTGIELTGLERRRLIAALLSRQHLILSGPAGVGKHELAHALALSIADGRPSRVCLLQGHPWWAARTGNVGFFVNLQTQFSVWQLAHFTASVLNGKPAPQDASTHLPGKLGGAGELGVFAEFSLDKLRTLSRGARAESDIGDHFVCVERMSPIEVELYFRVISEWLFRESDPQRQVGCVPIRLIGTFDSLTPPDLDDHILRVAALVHLNSAQHGDVRSPLPGMRSNDGRELASQWITVDRVSASYLVDGEGTR